MRAVTWSTTGLIYFGHIQAAAGHAIADVLRNSPSDETVFINCHGVNKVDPYALDPVKYLLASQERPVVLFAVRDSLKEDLDRMLVRATRSQPMSDGSSCIVYGRVRNPCHEIPDTVAAIASRLERHYVEKWVSDAFVPTNMRRLASTPILASGVFNAQSLASYPDRFIWLCLLMADRLETIIREYKLQNICVLAPSLRSSPFAAAVCHLFKPSIPLEVVDHLTARGKSAFCG